MIEPGIPHSQVLWYAGNALALAFLVLTCLSIACIVATGSVSYGAKERPWVSKMKPWLLLGWGAVGLIIFGFLSAWNFTLSRWTEMTISCFFFLLTATGVYGCIQDIPRGKARKLATRRSST